VNLPQNLARVRSLIGDATLVAATKYVGADVIRELVSLGIRDIGENRADAFLAKFEALGDLPVTWHFIGHLQSNKAKGVVEKISFLHSLDGLHLAAEIQKWRTSPLSCFVEVNISGEASKNGISPEKAEDFVRELGKYDRINVVGLMGMAAAGADSLSVEESFRLLAHCRDDIRDLGLAHAPCRFLSMGMSEDFGIAVRCGATHVRLGSILFRNEE
jgi:pyridoxal phosphate enzyme (YggS family)